MLYKFTPKQGVVLTPATAASIISCSGTECIAPIDFSLGEVRAVRRGEAVSLTLKWGDVEVPLEILARLAVSDKVLFLSSSGQLYTVEVRGEHYYKLRYLGEKVPPTLEIDGVHMHNISGTTPLLDAQQKVKMLGVKRGEKGLDVCTGLGYTAIESYRRGAEVLSVEVDENVLHIAEHNPFSRLLENIEIILGDAFEVLDELPEESFDFVLHDPPVFAFAQHLYSLEFYRKLHRVLRRGGRLFHYTGAPGKHRGIDLQRGVARRLREAGFTVTRIKKDYAILAVKI